MKTKSTLKEKNANDFLTHTQKERGITLIALVITIIILLILAGITISSLTGSGLFDNAKLAKEKSKEAQDKENETLKEYENAFLNNYENPIVSDTSRGDENYIIKITSDDENVNNWIKTPIIDKYTLNDVINDEKCMSELMNSEESVNYMMNNPTILNLFVKDNKAKEMLDSTNILTKIPELTEFTNELIYKESEASNPTWQICDSNKESIGSLYTAPTYVGYEFQTNVKLGIIYIKGYNSTEAPLERKYQYSDNGTDWYDLNSIIGTYNTKTMEVFDYITGLNVGHKYYRLYCTKNYAGQTDGWLALKDFQMYCY